MKLLFRLDDVLDYPEFSFVIVPSRVYPYLVEALSPKRYKQLGSNVPRLPFYVINYNDVWVRVSRELSVGNETKRTIKAKILDIVRGNFRTTSVRYETPAILRKEQELSYIREAIRREVERLPYPPKAVFLAVNDTSLETLRTLRNLLPFTRYNLYFLLHETVELGRYIRENGYGPEFLIPVSIGNEAIEKKVIRTLEEEVLTFLSPTKLWKALKLNAPDDAEISIFTIPTLKRPYISEDAVARFSIPTYISRSIEAIKEIFLRQLFPEHVLQRIKNIKSVYDAETELERLAYRISNLGIYVTKDDVHEKIRIIIDDAIDEEKLLSYHSA